MIRSFSSIDPFCAGQTGPDSGALLDSEWCILRIRPVLERGNCVPVGQTFDGAERMSSIAYSSNGGAIGRNGDGGNNRGFLIARSPFDNISTSIERILVLIDENKL